MKQIQRVFFVAIFILGLVYMIWPGPTGINDIPALPDSVKSSEPGDTTQVANVAAYFSNMRRKEVTDFYRHQFGYLKIFGVVIPPIKLNRPPEEAYTYIRDQQASTYLEEYAYPLRDSIFVNGFEPFNEQGKPYKLGATDIQIDGVFYDTKTTLRYYGSSLIWRLILYFGIWIGMYFTFQTIKEIVRKKPWN
jgi:hypothetical protein